MCPWKSPLREETRQCVSEQDEGGDGQTSSCQKLCIHINSLLSGLSAFRLITPFYHQTITSDILDVCLCMIIITYR